MLGGCSDVIYLRRTAPDTCELHRQLAALPSAGAPGPGTMQPDLWLAARTVSHTWTLPVKAVQSDF
jgi:hypothetical protein